VKTLLAFFAGSLVTTIAVVMAGGYHASFMILGVFLTVVGFVLCVWCLGIPRVCRWLLALHNANSAVSSFRVGAPQGVRRPTVAFQRSRAAKSGPHVVRSASMLTRVQQDVLSALVNLRMPFPQAEQAVLEAFRKGDSFEDLFKRALPSKSRAA